jgi:hypothetical protein
MRVKAVDAVCDGARAQTRLALLLTMSGLVACTSVRAVPGSAMTSDAGDAPSSPEPPETRREALDAGAGESVLDAGSTALQDAASAQADAATNTAIDGASADAGAVLPVGTCGAFGRLPGPAGWSVCAGPAPWTAPKLVYDGSPALDPPQAVVLKGADGLVAVGHFASAAGGGAVHNVFVRLDEHGDCRELIAESDGPRRVVLEARAAGGTTALLSGCDSSTGFACPTFVHVAGHEPFDLAANLDLGSFPQDLSPKTPGLCAAPSPVAPNDETWCALSNELAVTRDGRIVVVTGRMVYPAPAIGGEAGYRLRMRLLSPALEEIRSVTVPSAGNNLADIAVTTTDELLVLMDSGNLSGFSLAFEALPGRSYFQVPNYKTELGCLEVNDERLALSSSQIEMLDIATLRPVWPMHIEVPGPMPGTAGEAFSIRAVGYDGALDLTDDDELLRFMGKRVQPTPWLTLAAADGSDLWSAHYDGELDTANVPRAAIEAAVQLQSNGHVLASSANVVLGYCR